MEINHAKACHLQLLDFSVFDDVINDVIRHM
jgi:hypothetical protein